MMRMRLQRFLCNVSQQSIKTVSGYKTDSRHSRSSKQNSGHSYSYKIPVACGITLGAGFFFSSKSKSDDYGDPKDGLPLYTLSEIAEHSSVEKRVWIAYKHGVYDITDFIQKHPGGDQILLGAGSSVEPFWNLYAVHKSPHVLQILEQYRIGNLSEEDVGSTVKDMSDPFANDPRRHPILEPRSKKPFNAEPPASILPDSLITDNEFFYVRNHLPVPSVDASDFELEVEGLGMKDKKFTLEELKKMPRHTITATIQCGGNRRSEMMKVKPVRGLSWGRAAIGNAEWTGVKLRDVLLAAGIDENNKKIKHVQFEGMDTDPTGKPYGASIPIEKALSDYGEVLLAYEMNGQPIPKDHGFPLRVVVPGTVGARSVKWLSRIVVAEGESESHWQQNDYKGFAPNIDWDNVDFSKSPAIQDMPVTSAICVPENGTTVKMKDGKLHVSGYAFSGGGRKIVRVDISVDGGKNWREVDAYKTDDAEHPRAWGWTIWTADVTPPPGSNGADIIVKAVDSSYNTQPATFEDVWNLRGVLSNAYHRIHVNVK